MYEIRPARKKLVKVITFDSSPSHLEMTVTDLFGLHPRKHPQSMCPFGASPFLPHSLVPATSCEVLMIYATSIFFINFKNYIIPNICCQTNKKNPRNKSGILISTPSLAQYSIHYQPNQKSLASSLVPSKSRWYTKILP